jgi:nucleoside-diphosphate-sugar epimerase
MIIKAACALLAGLTGFIGNRLRERREDRAAAVVVLGTLSEALDKTHEPQLHPVRPVVIPFSSYAEVWNAERKALAKRMTDEEFSTAESAFAALASLQKSEELGDDLREEVFDGLLDAASHCEGARRVVWRQTQSPRDRVERWIRRRISDISGHALRSSRLLARSEGCPR